MDSLASIYLPYYYDGYVTVTGWLVIQHAPHKNASKVLQLLVEPDSPSDDDFEAFPRASTPPISNACGLSRTG